MTTRYPDLQGRSVFITGGGSGIGAALTDGFLAQGARVFFVQRSDATRFRDMMEAKHGTRPGFRPCDITQIRALSAALAEAAAKNGPIDILVNNAADDSRHATLEVTEADWDRIQAVNLKPYFFACRDVLAGMRQRGRGAIVNMSSITYLMGSPGMPGYVTANAGIVGLTRALAREFGPSGVRVNAVAPGMVITDRQMRLWLDEASIAAHQARQCLPIRLQPADMVDPVLFLASDASRAITGQCLPVDAGVVVSG